MSFLDDLANEIKACEKCGLCEKRTHAVPGSGNTATGGIMFIGEAPGANEDRKGKPFVGAAGRVLNGLLLHAALRREGVYITNLVKCRSMDEDGKNTPPNGEQVAACNENLLAEIATLCPQVMVLLGATTIREFIGDYPVGEVHGEVHEWQNIKCMAMYHPATLLYGKSALPKIEADFQKLRMFTEPLEIFEGARIVQIVIADTEGPWDEIRDSGSFSKLDDNLTSWVDYIIAFSAHVVKELPEERLLGRRVGVWLWEELVLEQDPDILMGLIRERLEGTNNLIKSLASSRASKTKQQEILREITKRGLVGSDSYAKLVGRLE